MLNGDALGGGAELAMACDLRVAMPHARIGFLQAKLNIATAWGGGTDLFNIVGPSRAMRLLTTAEVLGAADARQLGLVDAVAPEGMAAAGFVKSYDRRRSLRWPVLGLWWSPLRAPRLHLAVDLAIRNPAHS
ncbi:enoyl-CoA hydratase/isomerase family protein [Bradyrhizobium sp.]|uniref:enoyl-CoA hydratase/isomerase family protein n=1 Tax=Bradyrhizobium sp. TaxID=376 RepID=UPI003C729084